MEYAIDFGTSNTVVARVNENGVIETVKLPAYSSLVSDNPPLIPSFVYVVDAASEQVLIGQEVGDRGLDNKTGKGEQRFFKSFKRAIGSQVSMFVPEIDGREVEFELVGEWFLKRIIDQLPNVDSLIFTVPVDSFESYRNWLSGLCDRLSVHQVRILDEPTAAALGYGLSKGDETLLVVDFGGGTLDLSLVKLALAKDQSQDPFQDTSEAKPSRSPLGFLLKWGDRTVASTAKSSVASSSSRNSQIAKVLAKTGQNLGGIDIDNWIVDHFHTMLGLPKNSLVTRLAERIKIALSSTTSTTEVYFNDQTFESYELTLTRSQLAQILEQQQFFANLDRALDRIRQQAQRQNIDLEQIDAVLLVGGTSQIPAVKEWALRYFPIEKVKADKPFEAIAHGAISQGWELKDFLYHSYGVRYWDKRYKKHNWHTIVKSGATYPLEKPVELTLGASSPDQPSIELVIGELGETNVEVYFEDRRLVTRVLDGKQVAAQILNENSKAIAKLDPLGQMGSDRIKVFFQVDEKRTLRITVQDLLTKKNLLDDVSVVQLM
ncbi:MULTISPECIES: Hsp70 family protein [Pseudanabaena]|uniref:Heat shock protein 70 n=2 Tax=Pseudanabaena TaxID=1152 RepID=L8N4I1_9CYAN|nr:MULTISPECIES: Hsp70 family protein [Pseudanabaena]ELS33615.1 Heat shock protein 70 [Pseudanabaena biceps PCC 7429]MDG3494168.1 Hsp70 family protein [Pseudanabaena catenata USMAC16]